MKKKRHWFKHPVIMEIIKLINTRKRI